MRLFSPAPSAWRRQPAPGAPLRLGWRGARTGQQTWWSPAGPQLAVPQNRAGLSTRPPSCGHLRTQGAASAKPDMCRQEAREPVFESRVALVVSYDDDRHSLSTSAGFKPSTLQSCVAPTNTVRDSSSSECCDIASHVARLLAVRTLLQLGGPEGEAACVCTGRASPRSAPASRCDGLG